MGGATVPAGPARQDRAPGREMFERAVGCASGTGGGSWAGPEPRGQTAGDDGTAAPGLPRMDGNGTGGIQRRTGAV